MYPDDRNAYWESRCRKLEDFLSDLLLQTWVPPEVKQQLWGLQLPPPQLQALLPSIPSSHLQIPSSFSSSNYARIAAISDAANSVNDSSDEDDLEVIVWEPGQSNLRARSSEPRELRELKQFLNHIKAPDSWNFDWINGAEAVHILLERLQCDMAGVSQPVGISRRTCLRIHTTSASLFPRSMIIRNLRMLHRS